ncbi:kinase-like protein [Trichoderma evansii]
MNSAQDKPELPGTQSSPPQNSDIDQPSEHSSQPGAATEEIEEGRAAYTSGGFHPVYIDDIFNNRFKVLSKIGYGRYSTVWLVRDLQASNIQHEFRALKILSAGSYGGGNDIFEREILTHLRNGEDRNLFGYKYICHLISQFEHQGPNGTHICFIFELMGETLLSFGAWFSRGMIPYSVMRRFAIQLPDNIFVKFRDYSLVESGYLKAIDIPQQDREEPQYSPIPSDDNRVDEFDIKLGDWGVSSWTAKHLTEKIQPVALRSPEVLIEAPWGTATDWWNLGAVILELFRVVRIFSGRVPPDGHYELKRHLTEVVDLFGPFPTKLLEKGNPDIVGRLFDSEGRVQDPDPVDGPGLLSEDWLPGLDQEQRECFVSFLKTMMKIDPEERPTPEDILRHPWLGALA